MKKRLFVFGHWMKIDGVSVSLLGLLKELDYSQVDVDLMLISAEGELLKEMPPEVNLLHTPDCVARYWNLATTGRKRSLKAYFISKFSLYLAGIWYRIFRRMKIDPYGRGLIRGALYGSLMLPRRITDREYDLALFFSCEPTFCGRVKARKTAVWVHTDWGYFHPIRFLVNLLFSRADYIVNVSPTAKQSFDKLLNEKLKARSIVIENALSPKWMMSRANAMKLPQTAATKILSVGRLTMAKNYFRALEAAKILKDRGMDFEWRIVGAGELENQLRQKVMELNLGGCVIMVGSVDNPYPYYRWADIFVCTSDWEGKSVSVREAQVFAVPTIITRYGTASAQLDDGVDGIIVEKTAEAVADGVMRMVSDPDLAKRLSKGCENRDYTNSQEVRKVMEL